MGVQKMGKRLLVIKKLKALMNNGQSGQSDSGVEAEGTFYELFIQHLRYHSNHSFKFVF